MDLIERHGVDWTVMVPTMIAMLLDHPDFRPERLARCASSSTAPRPCPPACSTGSASCSPGLRLCQGYGMTECSSVLTLLAAADHRAGGERLRSAGRPMTGVELSPSRTATGDRVPEGENGEVCARAGNFMRRVLEQARDHRECSATAGTTPVTRATSTTTATVYLVDRVKDMIVTGGENVYSVEVEKAISTHPAVAQVAVIGIPHDDLGRAGPRHRRAASPAATVTEEEIQATPSSDRGYKVPKSVEFRAEPLPLSGAMKPLKRDLRGRTGSMLPTPARKARKCHVVSLATAPPSSRKPGSGDRHCEAVTGVRRNSAVTGSGRCECSGL